MADGATSIGIVAIGRNEGERLVRCLASIPAGVPTIYVDSASTDGSPERARAAGATVHSLDMARPFTAARARAEGVAVLFDRHPGIEFLMFVDGDCEIEKDWLKIAADFLEQNTDFAAVCGRRRERFPEASFYNALADYEWSQPAGEAEACGGDAMMRASAYQAVGGFDAKMIAGEEPELCGRLRAAKWRIMRLDAPMTIHDAATFRFSQWWKRGVRSGFGYAQAWRVTRAQGQPLYNRELSRAFGWGAILPLVSIVGAVVIHPLAVLLWPGMNLLQIARWSPRVGVRHATLAAVAHFAELAGALRYIGRALRGDAGGTLVYK
ncbi:MAG: glycosyltransferase [Sphingomonas sp.]|uniref:glycosyltransferase n=1 Tax=Sphingomonas sp. TaxID=28214 RepID=UPI001AC3B32E|nr:glycosyltransferase [Sphingomonas sp.]MBN8814148.1 glycosyltransferase [Sphingomonas sp.]